MDAPPTRSCAATIRCRHALEPLKDPPKSAVLVMDNGSITGLLTRFDFLKFIHAK